LQRAGERRLNRPKRFQSTLALTEPPATARELDPSRYLVFPLRKSPRSTIDRFYSVGQTRNNDIVIRDATVSKSHAFFENAQDGSGLVLKDSRSRNGTFVNGAKVPAEGTPVKPGDRVRFGHVELKLLDADQLCELVRRSKRSG
jgi:pSer/pThr/pTyr-binding forkhead associated (FHA) protein